MRKPSRVEVSVEALEAGVRELKACEAERNLAFIVAMEVLVDTFRVMKWSRGRSAARGRSDRAALSSSDGPACLGLEAVSHRE